MTYVDALASNPQAQKDCFGMSKYFLHRVDVDLKLRSNIMSKLRFDLTEVHWNFNI